MRFGDVGGLVVDSNVGGGGAEEGLLEERSGGGKRIVARGMITRTPTSLKTIQPFPQLLLPTQLHPTRPISIRTRSAALFPPRVGAVQTMLLTPRIETEPI
jgi:hypothetical protein